MRHPNRLAAVAASLAVALVLGACGSSGPSGPAVSHEEAVPEGMPVMYEFYTTS